MLVNRKVVGTISPQFGLPSVLTTFAKAYGELIAYSYQYVCGPDQTIHFEYPKHSYHPIARNDVAKASLGEWLLTLDADH